MKKNYPCLPIATGIMALSVQLLNISICTAQISTINLKPAPANVAVDGSLTEWGDSLSYYNSETQFNYTLANDKDNLYLALKTNDPVEQARILSWGITLSVDTKGRKKSTYSVIFPVQEQDNPAFANSTASAQDKRLQISLTKFKKLKADGFKDVEYDLITLENTYGFRAAINYDAHGFMVYEEKIPLSLFHADDLKKTEWAFDIKINSPQLAAKPDTDDGEAINGGAGRHGGAGGRRGGGMGGGMGGGGRGGRGGAGGNSSGETPKSAPKPVDFWGKFVLAKAQ